MREQEKGNKLIADFLGWENYGDGKTYKFPNLYPIHNIDDEENTGWISEQISKAMFHSSWDWLMPVVEKIEAYKYADNDGTDEIYNFAFLRTFVRNMVRINRSQLFEANTKLYATWLAVVDFIEWYNAEIKNVQPL